MTAALLDQGKTSARDVLKALWTHVGISTDSTVWVGNQTAINPSGAGTNLIKTGAKVNVDGNTFDTTMSINGSTEFTGLSIHTLSLHIGPLRTDASSRSVRPITPTDLGIGVQSGDAFSIGVRVAVADNS